jgi:integrase
MPTTKLTTIEAVEALPHPKTGQVIYFCTDLKGFGVRVGVRDKVFVVQRKVKGKAVKVTLGRYGDMSLQAARRDAEQTTGNLRNGINQNEQKRKSTAGGMTLRDAWELYKGHLAAKGRRESTREGYRMLLEAHLGDWLDRPLAEIDRETVHKRHIKIGTNNGKYSANHTMRALRAIWRRARRQHPGLEEPPTVNVDFFAELRRTRVVTDLRTWCGSVQSHIENPIRRDLYFWLLFTGCRVGESCAMEWDHVDLDKGIVKFPITKTEAFELPLSDYLVKLLRARKACPETIKQFGKDCRWVFPALLGKSGHIEEWKLNKGEADLFNKTPWTVHTLRHTWNTISQNKVRMPRAHSVMLQNHKERFAINGDAHEGYNHPDLDDLRKSQQKMSNYLISQINPKPKPIKVKVRGNVIEFKKLRRNSPH